jgi:hypothetical protein
MAFALQTAVFAALAFGPVQHVSAAVSSKSCSCYRTSSNDLFTDYKFHDFRSVGTSSIPELPSRLPSSADDNTGQSADDIGTLQSGFISSKEWTSNWAIQDWGKGINGDTKYRMWNSLSAVYIDKNADGDGNANTKLVLKTKRFAGFQVAAEIENLYVFVHLEVRGGRWT